ncbi:hypothetical protein TKV_c00380 [Thermoanaerobacter kivui]|uniref:Uncharacterized protein n=1 Tax=Thermoanaerobacter kivui TaxID=2325 RepID=A0A097AN59_THEKI|nr:hypothetical protein TKV_c00380 [Thermoanaerobacter kivui]
MTNIIVEFIKLFERVKEDRIKILEGEIDLVYIR